MNRWCCVHTVGALLWVKMPCSHARTHFKSEVTSSHLKSVSAGFFMSRILEGPLHDAACVRGGTAMSSPLRGSAGGWHHPLGSCSVYCLCLRRPGTEPGMEGQEARALACSLLSQSVCPGSWQLSPDMQPHACDGEEFCTNRP